MRSLVFGLALAVSGGAVFAEDILTKQEAEAAVEAFYGDPERMLRYSYHNYMIVNVCYEARKGLAFQYVNGVDLERAQDLSGQIQTVLLGRDEALDLDALWQEAFERFGDMSMTPLIYVKRLGGLNDIFYNSAQSAFRGKTGAERNVFFANGVRANGPNAEQLKGICQTALEALSTDLLKINGGGLSKVPQKAF